MADRCDHCSVRMDGYEVHAADCPVRGPEIREESERIKAELKEITEERDKLLLQLDQVRKNADLWMERSYENELAAIKFRKELEESNRLYSEVLDLLESHGRFQCVVWHDGRVGCGTCARCKLNAISKKTEKRKCVHVFINYQCEKCGAGQDTEKKTCDVLSPSGVLCEMSMGHSGSHRGLDNQWPNDELHNSKRRMT